jgi:hypothetical protein
MSPFAGTQELSWKAIARRWRFDRAVQRTRTVVQVGHEERGVGRVESPDERFTTRWRRPPAPRIERTKAGKHRLRLHPWDKRQPGRVEGQRDGYRHLWVHAQQTLDDRAKFIRSPMYDEDEVVLIEVPKDDGTVRDLWVPPYAERVVQGMIAETLSAALEPLFLSGRDHAGRGSMRSWPRSGRFAMASYTSRSST